MSKPKKRGFNGLMKFLTHPYRLMSINKSSLEERQVTEFKGYQLVVFGFYSFLVLFIVSFLIFLLTKSSTFTKDKKPN